MPPKNKKTVRKNTLAAGLFNRDETPQTVTARWSDLGLSDKMRVRDLWRQKNVSTFENAFEAEAPRHGVALVRRWPAE